MNSFTDSKYGTDGVDVEFCGSVEIGIALVDVIREESWYGINPSEVVVDTSIGEVEFW